jgi:hypothetical protein
MRAVENRGNGEKSRGRFVVAGGKSLRWLDMGRLGSGNLLVLLRKNDRIWREFWWIVAARALVWPFPAWKLASPGLLFLFHRERMKIAAGGTIIGSRPMAVGGQHQPSAPKGGHLGLPS